MPITLKPNGTASLELGDAETVENIRRSMFHVLKSTPEALPPEVLYWYLELLEQL